MRGVDRTALHQAEGMTTPVLPPEASPRPRISMRQASRDLVTSLGSPIFLGLSEHVTIRPHEGSDGLILGVDSPKAPAALLDAPIGQVSSLYDVFNVIFLPYPTIYLGNEK